MFIKRILISFLLLTVLCIFSSCNNISNSTDQTTDNNNNDDLIADTNTDTNTDIDNIDTKPNTDTSTGSNGSLSTDLDSDIMTDTATDSESQSKAEFGNFTTLHKTIPSDDRMKQMRESKAVFNTGTKYTPDELRGTRIQANIIASAKFLFPNASDFMDHYLEGKGEIYELDVDDFLENKIAQENMYKDVNEALRAAENMVISGEKITIYQIEESLHHNLTGDWRYSVGSYFASVELYDVKETNWFGVTYYTAKLKYVIQDFYNWDPNDTNDISITSVSPADLHQLHLSGEAQEFLTYGEEEYEIRWVKGVDASTLKFNDKD